MRITDRLRLACRAWMDAPRIHARLNEFEKPPEERQYLICDFCEKPSEDVRKLIASVRGYCICDECIELCNEILAEELGES